MNGDDQALREILRAVGSLESTLRAQAETNTELKAEVRDLGDKLDVAMTTCHNFENFEGEYRKYKEDRKDIPLRLQTLERTAADYELLKQEFIVLKSQYNRLYILGIALQAIGLGLLWLIGKGYMRIEL